VKALRNAALAGCTGYVLFYFSELLFWARPREEDTLDGWVGTWLVYSVLAYATLALAWRFGARAWWAMFLVGAVFGWLVEGVVVTTTYEALPLSVSFTALAWHALISVMVGLLAVDRAVRSGTTRAFVRIGVLTGLGYGFWAINWWVEEDHQVPVESFAAFSLVATILLVVAYAVAGRLFRQGFRPGRVGVTVTLVLLGLQYVVTGVFVTWLAFIVLPPLLWFTWRALSRSEEPGRVRVPLELHLPTRVRNLAWLLAIPGVAIAVYVAAFAARLELATNWIVYLVLMPTGFVVYGVAVSRAMRQARVVRR
jgi:hypothetical protein